MGKHVIQGVTRADPEPITKMRTEPVILCRARSTCEMPQEGGIRKARVNEMKVNGIDKLQSFNMRGEDGLEQRRPYANR